jgi:hypothetical protein
MIPVLFGFGVSWLGDTLDSLALLALGVAIMIPGLAFNFYLAFSKDRLDGT